MIATVVSMQMSATITAPADPAGSLELVRAWARSDPAAVAAVVVALAAGLAGQVVIVHDPLAGARLAEAGILRSIRP